MKRVLTAMAHQQDPKKAHQHVLSSAHRLHSYMLSVGLPRQSGFYNFLVLSKVGFWMACYWKGVSSRQEPQKAKSRSTPPSRHMSRRFSPGTSRSHNEPSRSTSRFYESTSRPRYQNAPSTIFAKNGTFSSFPRIRNGCHRF